MGRVRLGLGVVGAALVLAAPASAMVLQLPPPELSDWGSWPVEPLFEQHPIRAGFEDPRLNGVYHTGVDISVRDDQPEPGHPPKRTHSVYAIESGTVSMPAGEDDLSCQARHVTVGDFGYGHVDPVGTVEPGEHVSAGQMIGWTCYHHWHLHLSEFATRDGQRVYVNPLEPGSRLEPYVDTAPPEIDAIRFYTPVTPTWETVLGALYSSPDGERVPADGLHGEVDVRALVADPQSFHGWMKGRLSLLRTRITPYELRVVLRRELGDKVASRVLFKASELPAEPFDDRFAPGTRQNLPAYDCRVSQPIDCVGGYWYHASPVVGSTYWDTTTVADGTYQLCLTAFDVARNFSSRCATVSVANGSL